MTAGAAAASRRRAGSGTPTNIIANGGFDDTSAWRNQGSNGLSIAGGKGVYTNSTAYSSSLNQIVAMPGPAYYEVTFTISNRGASGEVRPYFYNGSQVSGSFRAANGTFVERILTRAGDTEFGFQPTASGGTTLSIDDVTVIGPYTTATVGGA